MCGPQNHTHSVTQTHMYEMVKFQEKVQGRHITAYYSVCAAARLPGSPEVATIDLSNISFQRFILSPLLVSGICQRLPHERHWPQCQNRAQNITAAAEMNTATLPLSALEFNIPNVHIGPLFNALVIGPNILLLVHIEGSGLIHHTNLISFHCNETPRPGENKIDFSIYLRSCFFHVSSQPASWL